MTNGPPGAQKKSFGAGKYPDGSREVNAIFASAILAGNLALHWARNIIDPIERVCRDDEF